MKLLHYSRLLTSLVSWQARTLNEKSVNKLLEISEVFDKSVIRFILPILLSVSYYVLGFVLGFMDRQFMKRTNADRELDKIVSLVSYTILLFIVIDSVPSSFEKFKLIAVFLICFVFSWFSAYADSLRPKQPYKPDPLRMIIEVMAFLWIPLHWLQLCGKDGAVFKKEGHQEAFVTFHHWCQLAMVIKVLLYDLFHFLFKDVVVIIDLDLNQ